MSCLWGIVSTKLPVVQNWCISCCRMLEHVFSQWLEVRMHQLSRLRQLRDCQLCPIFHYYSLACCQPAFCKVCLLPHILLQLCMCHLYDLTTGLWRIELLILIFGSGTDLMLLLVLLLFFFLLGQPLQRSPRMHLSNRIGMNWHSSSSKYTLIEAVRILTWHHVFNVVAMTFHT